MRRSQLAIAPELALRDYLAAKYEPAGNHDPRRVLVAECLVFYARQVAPGHKARATTAFAIDRLVGYWQARTLDQVRRSTCADYVAWRTSQAIPQARTAASARPISIETARRELGVLRAAIRAYHAEHGFDAVPVVTLPPAAPPRDRWLTRDEIAAFLHAARRHPDREAGRAIVRLLLLGVYTGTRSTAIRQLTWLPTVIGGWVDLDRGVIHRRAAGEAESNKRSPPLRTPSSPPRPFARLAAPRRCPWSGSRHQLWRRRRRSPAPRLVDGARRSQPSAPTWCLHTLRHTATTCSCSLAFRYGKAAGFLGMSPETLWRVYGHHSPDYQSELAERFGRR